MRIGTRQLGLTGLLLTGILALWTAPGWAQNGVWIDGLSVDQEAASTAGDEVRRQPKAARDDEADLPEISLSELLAALREYPPEVVRALIVLGEQPEVLSSLAENPDFFQNPDRIEPKPSGEVRDAIRDLRRVPAVVGLAAVHADKTRRLAHLHADAPEGLERRLDELREAYRDARLEAAGDWEEMLEDDPAALGAYRELVTRFTREQLERTADFPYIEVTDRRYYYACPPNEAIMAFAAEHGGEFAGVDKLLRKWWAEHNPARIDGVALSRGEIGRRGSARGLAAGPRHERADMWRPAEGRGRESEKAGGLAPVIMQPLDDQPPDARLAFAVAENARLWAPAVDEDGELELSEAPRLAGRDEVVEREVDEPGVVRKETSREVEIQEEIVRGEPPGDVEIREEVVGAEPPAEVEIREEVVRAEPPAEVEIREEIVHAGPPAEVEIHEEIVHGVPDDYDHRPSRRYYDIDIYDYDDYPVYGGYSSLSFYYSSFLPYYAGYPFCSPIYTGCLPRYYDVYPYYYDPCYPRGSSIVSFFGGRHYSVGVRFGRFAPSHCYSSIYVPTWCSHDSVCVDRGFHRRPFDRDRLVFGVRGTRDHRSLLRPHRALSSGRDHSPRFTTGDIRGDLRRLDRATPITRDSRDGGRLSGRTLDRGALDGRTLDREGRTLDRRTLDRRALDSRTSEGRTSDARTAGRRTLTADSLRNSGQVRSGSLRDARPGGDGDRPVRTLQRSPAGQSGIDGSSSREGRTLRRSFDGGGDGASRRVDPMSIFGSGSRSILPRTSGSDSRPGERRSTGQRSFPSRSTAPAGGSRSGSSRPSFSAPRPSGRSESFSSPRTERRSSGGRSFGSGFSAPRSHRGGSFGGGSRQFSPSRSSGSSGRSFSSSRSSGAGGRSFGHSRGSSGRGR